MRRQIASLSPLLLACACATSDGGGAASKPHPRGALWRAQQRLDEHGRIPTGALMRAVAQRDAMPVAANGAATPQWTWMGPGNIGGRVRGIAIHPTRPGTMWTAAAGGGVWKTVDGGASWQPTSSALSLLALGSMAIDPADPDRLYVGTGEGFFDTVAGSSILAAVRGAGIFVSTDSGANWSQLPATAGWEATNRIAIDPNDSRILVAATTAGIHRSTDRGASWTRVTTTDAMDVQFHPTDSSRLVAGTGTGAALYSTNGGQTWSAATGITQAIRVEVRYYRGSPNVVYATVNGTNGRIRVYRSNNGGQSYSVRTSGSGVSCLGRYNNGLWVDPTNENRLLIGATRVHRSLDGGVNLTQITNGGYYDYHVLVEHPGFNGQSNRTVFSGSDGGVHRLGDVAAGSPNWQELNNNLGVNQFYGAAINPISGVIFGGTQDQGTLRYNGSTETWSQPAGGDGGFCATDPTNPNLFYGEYQWLSLFRSQNGGQSISSIDSGINESSPNFIAPFVLDPNDPRRMLAGGARLWRTNEVRSGQPSWTSIKPAINCGGAAPGTPAHYLSDPPCNISAIAVAVGNSDIVWVGHNNGELWVTQNGTAGSPGWSRVDTTVPDRWVSRIAVDPRDARRAYVSFMGYAPDNVWLTEDLGQSWRSIGGALPQVPVSGLAVHPTTPGLLFAGTDVGVFQSIDDGASWTVVPGGPINASVEQLVWKDRRVLMAVTHGLGIFLADLGSAAVNPVGTGCGAAGTPSLNASGPVLGTSQSYTASGLTAGAPVHLLVALGGASPTSLGGGCALQPSLATIVALPAGATGPAGTWSLSVPLPDEASLVGAAVTAQLLAVVAGGPALGVAELTNGVEMTFGY